MLHTCEYSYVTILKAVSDIQSRVRGLIAKGKREKFIGNDLIFIFFKDNFRCLSVERFVLEVPESEKCV